MVEEHKHHLSQVLHILRSNKFYVKQSQCELFSLSVECLGHIVSNKGILVDPRKVNLIVEWGIHRYKIEVQSFLGLVSYY